MHYPLWKEESIPDLINDDEDIELLKDRNYETLLEYDIIDEPQSNQQKARQREEAEIAKFNFENYLIRQQLEEEEEQMRNLITTGGGGEEMKSSRPAACLDYDDSDDSDDDDGGRTGTSNA